MNIILGLLCIVALAGFVFFLLPSSKTKNKKDKQDDTDINGYDGDSDDEYNDD